MRRAARVVVLALLLASCSSNTAAPTTAPSSTAPAAPASTPATIAPTPQPLPAVPRLRLVNVATVSQPVAMATLGDTIYIAEKTGRVRAIKGGKLQAGSVVDLSRSVSRGSEQGLLGIAFNRSGTRLYTNHTDRSGDTRVGEYRFSSGRASGRRELLRVVQPFSNHNGGHLATGPDGFLYIFLGDGGSGGDPRNNGQRLDTLLGKVLRIDPSRGSPYAVPSSNPFVSRTGAKREIWAYGLRNPWRASFDRSTGDLWIADVGQNAIEEINRQRASAGGGQNYGWRNLEGTRTFSGRAPRGNVPPVYQYNRSGGNCAVVGGVVYRGSRIPALRGRFLFSDFCGGALRALRLKDGRFVADTLLDIPGGPTAFGEDRNGEVYVMALSGKVARLDRA